MREFFERMPEDLRGGLHRRTFCKGEPVLLAGEENRCIYMVERGTAMGTSSGNWRSSARGSRPSR